VRAVLRVGLGATLVAGIALASGLATPWWATAAAAAGPATTTATHADSSTATGTAASTATATATGTAAGTADGLVVVGVGGLLWDDLDRATTPTLWRLVGEGSVGSVSVRTSTGSTCALDGWLTVSAGVQTPASRDRTGAGSGTGEQPGPDATTDCPVLPEVVRDSAMAGSGATVADWASLPAPPVGSDVPSAAPGLLGAAVTERGACSLAVGPGAAVALADAAGRVGRYAEHPADLTDAELTACPVVVVDAGELTDTGARRVAQLRTLDAMLDDLVARLPDGWRLVVTGVADTSVRQHELEVALDWTAGAPTRGWLTSGSTRRTGLVTLTDLTATAVAQVGGSTDALDGAPLEVQADRRLTTDRTVENRRYLTQVTSTVKVVMPTLVALVVAAALAAAGALALARRRPRGASPAVSRVALATLLLAVSMPAGAFLAALTRWWTTPEPLVVAAASAVVATVVVALVALGVSRLLPPGPWRLAAAAAGLTWLVLTVDGLTGTTLQQGSVLGSMSTLGARYYGFSNTAFSIYGTSALVLAGALAAMLAGRSRRLTVLVVAGLGLVSVVVDGWPAFGADFGGILALVPAFTLLLLGALGIAVTARRMVVALLAGVVAVALVATIDWLRPGPGSHLGAFVQRIVDGDALATVAGKAVAAWGTLWNPLGGPVAVVCVVGVLALVGPRRRRPAVIAEAYARVPMLRPVAVAGVTLALVGAALNDSGVSVLAIVLAFGAGLIGTSLAAHGSRAGPDEGRPDAGRPDEGRPDAGRPDELAPHAGRPDDAGSPAHRPVAVLVAVGGALLAVVVLATSLAPTATARAGDVTGPLDGVLVTSAAPTVVVGVGGLRWQDVTPTGTPTLWGLLRDGAAAAAITPGVGGVNASCEAAGWLALSSGRAPVTGASAGGTWRCEPWWLTTPAGGANVQGWDALVSAQARSSFHPQLGTLGDALAEAGVCRTAIGPGAALALAGADGRLPRYRDLATALDDPEEAFSCPVTVVDAGSAPYDPGALDTDVTALAARQAELAAADTVVRRVLAAAPDGATIVVVGVGNPVRTTAWLGVGLVRAQGAPAQRFAASAATHWEGVARLLDVPTSLTAAYATAVPAEFTGAPLASARTRGSDAATVVDELAGLSTRDHVLRAVAGSSTTVPTLISLALLALLLWWPTARTRRRRALDGVLLVLAVLPAGLFWLSAWSWWRFAPSSATLGAAALVSVACLAGAAALAPRRPVWAAPGLIAGVTFVVLSIDAAFGTPLHRGSPLGPAVTSGGRYYGFGNPTYSVYVVAALVLAAALGTALLRAGRRGAAIVASALVGVVALAVDLLPSLGADIGGGLVLVPSTAVVVLAVAGVRVTWRRLLGLGAAGAAVVAVIGLADWLRPVEQRTHLGTFVQQVLDGTAWETVSRKAGYAAGTLTSGPVAWLTLAVLVATGVVVWRAGRGHVGRLTAVEREWPLVRPLLVALLVAAVGGALLNDYGLRIVTVMLFAAVPLAGLVLLRLAPGPEPLPAPEPLPCDEIAAPAAPQEER